MMNRLLSCLFIYKTRKEPVWFAVFYKNFTIVLRLSQTEPHRLVQHLRDILADDQRGQAVVGRFIPVDEHQGHARAQIPHQPRRRVHHQRRAAHDQQIAAPHGAHGGFQLSLIHISSTGRPFKRLTLETAQEGVQKPLLKMDEGQYYDMLSAFIKSMRCLLYTSRCV